MEYKRGQLIKYKKKFGRVVFFYPDYKNGKNAYTIELLKDKRHRLCYEDEIHLPEQVSFFDMDENF